VQNPDAHSVETAHACPAALPAAPSVGGFDVFVPVGLGDEASSESTGSSPTQPTIEFPAQATPDMAATTKISCFGDIASAYPGFTRRKGAVSTLSMGRGTRSARRSRV
jgi:hypothetical protein